ncbi:MATE family efflux transporter [Bacteroidales bacterium OttesenSCG-928-M11]|nr:MATE family efflux transporter [Bacteroidales bacterium OttesenSCG-928-M11]
MERDAIDFETLKVSKLFRKLFFPTLMGMLSISAVTAIDGIFVGHGVGSDGIAAVNICVPLLMLFTGLGLMIGSGCSVVTSIHLSKKKYKIARLNVTQALLFVTIVTVTFTAFIMIFPEQTAFLLGSSEQLLPMVKDYLLWFIPSLTFQMWISVSLFIIRLDGAPKLAMYCSLISAVVNVVLDWLFIFPLGWGVMGAAFATSISIVTGGLIAIIYLLFFANSLRPHPIKISRKSLLLSLRNIYYQCRIGSSSFLGEATLAMLMFMGNLVFMHYLGDDGVGAFGIACYYLPFVFMIGNSIAQSAQPIISYNFGAKKPHRVASTIKISLYTAIICGVIVTVVFLFFPKFLVSLFLDTNNSAALIAINGFPYFAIGFIFFIMNLCIIGYYQSMEKIKPATGFALLRGFIFLIPCFLLTPKLLNEPGIWLALPISEILTMVFIIIYFLYFRIRDKKTASLE